MPQEKFDDRMVKSPVNAFDTFPFDNFVDVAINDDIGFKFINNQSSVTQVGSCKKLAGPTAGQEITTLTTQAQCEQNNNSWEQHYQYTAGNTCGSIGSAQLTGQPDRPTDWTGGEISTDDGIHRSECSPSIMNSCNVNCDAGYGGGIAGSAFGNYFNGKNITVASRILTD